jgi:hypothetical protein
VPTPAHSGPDTSQSGRTQKAGPSTSRAFVPAAAAAAVPRRAFQQANATSVLELDVVAAPHSASVLEAEIGPGAAAGCTVTVGVGVTVAGLGAAAGSGADPEFEFVPAEGGPLPVGVAPEDSTVPSNCPALDMAARTPSGAGVVGPVALVATEAVLGVEAAFGVALPHKRHFDLG